MPEKRILVIGYGNPGRCDDGLGPALAARLEALGISGLTVDIDYQLTVEHAAIAAEHEVVVFVDAATDAESDFYFRPVLPAQSAAFSTHGITPEEVLALARSCFNASPEAYILGIRADVLDRFQEGLTPAAQARLEPALRYLQQFIARQQEQAEGRKK